MAVTVAVRQLPAPPPAAAQAAAAAAVAGLQSSVGHRCGYIYSWTGAGRSGCGPTSRRLTPRCARLLQLHRPSMRSLGIAAFYNCWLPSAYKLPLSCYHLPGNCHSPAGYHLPVHYLLPVLASCLWVSTATLLLATTCLCTPTLSAGSLLAVNCHCPAGCLAADSFTHPESCLRAVSQPVLP